MSQIAEISKEERALSSEYTFKEKVLKTIFLVISWTALGLQQEITNTTLNDLIILTNSNYEVISRAMLGVGVGYIISAVIGGPVVDMFKNSNDLMIASCLLVSALATFLTPYSSYFIILWILFFVRGMCAGLQNLAGQIIIFDLWKEKATGPMHIIHCGYGIGAFIIPLIANPFLAVLKPSHANDSISMSTNITTTFSTYPRLEFNATITQYTKESRIKTAYLITALVVASVSFVFVFYQFCYRKISHLSFNKIETESKFKKLLKLIDTGTCANGHRLFGAEIIGILIFYFFNALGGEVIFKTFLRSYSIDNLKFSGDDGSILNTIFAISYTVSRFAGLLTGSIIPIRILLVLESSGLLLTTIMLEIFARDNKLALWILVVPMGIFVSPLYPSGMGWGNFFISMTGTATAVLLIGGSIGAMAYGWLMGYLYEHYGYEMFMHQTLAFGVIMFLCTILMVVLTFHNAKRAATNNDRNVSTCKQVELNEKEILYQNLYVGSELK
ncbi:sodium-dependent glucose transporter 1C-like [Mytilus californianus]|uniref:sodium-dependent glucose transporter 1C-like n=1 Tax=Mytilus californianus TaxID=6549 RepID=UPI0022483EB5|nr:sodium-dependent glucose transporter 1C-like [Mytilus californianus]